MEESTKVQKVTSGHGGTSGPKIETFAHVEDGLVLLITSLIVDGLPCGWTTKEVKICPIQRNTAPDEL